MTTAAEKTRSRRRRLYAADAEIDRAVAAAGRAGLTVGAITLHADGGVTVAHAAPAFTPSEDDGDALERWKARKAARQAGRARS